tara:strand:+ start:546 stop:806 length:261 start_codon:yes stop_codon:yes gene_type:complete
MKNITLDISEDVQTKITYKHGITLDELKTSLLYGKPKVFKLKGEVHVALTHFHRYITIIFDRDGNQAKVRTAFPSSEEQIRRYKRK